MVEGKDKVCMDVSSVVLSAGADAVPCQLCRVCTLVCVLSVDGLAVAGWFHLMRLFTAGSGWGHPRLLAVDLCDALIPFCSASEDRVCVAPGLPGLQG